VPWKIKKLSNKSSWAFTAATGQVLRARNYGCFFHWWEIVCCGFRKNSRNDLVYAALVTKQRDISASYRLYLHPTFIKSIQFLLRYQNSVIPSLFSLNRTLKWTGNIIKKCWWCRNCCQWSAALLEMCLFSSDTVHQHIVLMTWSSFCAMRHTIHLLMWPVNITDLNPVDYHILWCCLSEIKVAIQHNNQLFSKPSTFLGEHNFIQMYEFCISQGSAVTFYRCGGLMHHLC